MTDLITSAVLDVHLGRVVDVIRQRDLAGWFTPGLRTFVEELTKLSLSQLANPETLGLIVVTRADLKGKVFEKVESRLGVDHDCRRLLFKLTADRAKRSVEVEERQVIEFFLNEGCARAPANRALCRLSV